ISRHVTTGVDELHKRQAVAAVSVKGALIHLLTAPAAHQECPVRWAQCLEELVSIIGSVGIQRLSYHLGQGRPTTDRNLKISGSGSASGGWRGERGALWMGRLIQPIDAGAQQRQNDKGGEGRGTISPGCGAEEIDPLNYLAQWPLDCAPERRWLAW